MTRKFLCVQGSPEIPKGAIAHYVEKQNKYFVWQHEPLFVGNTPVGSFPVEHSASFLPWQIEGNTCWEEVTISPEPTKRWVPELGDKYYFINSYNEVSSPVWYNDVEDINLFQIGNVYRTEQEAQDEVKRRNSIAKAWWPEFGEPCWMWRGYSGLLKIDEYIDAFTADCYIGACHKTKEACEEWGKEYGHLFDKRPAHGK